MTPIAMVIDRSMGARIAKDVHEFGGAWEEMFNAWHQMTVPKYLVMMAHTKERMRMRAPLVAMVMDDDGLRETLRLFCQQLDNTKCRWALFVEQGSTAEQITRQEILADSITQGNA
jgi:hypothetical protein